MEIFCGSTYCSGIACFVAIYIRTRILLKAQRHTRLVLQRVLMRHLLNDPDGNGRHDLGGVGNGAGAYFASLCDSRGLSRLLYANVVSPKDSDLLECCLQLCGALTDLLHKHWLVTQWHALAAVDLLTRSTEAFNSTLPTATAARRGGYSNSSETFAALTTSVCGTSDALTFCETAAALQAHVAGCTSATSTAAAAHVVNLHRCRSINPKATTCSGESCAAGASWSASPMCGNMCGPDSFQCIQKQTKVVQTNAADDSQLGVQEVTAEVRLLKAERFAEEARRLACCGIALEKTRPAIWGACEEQLIMFITALDVGSDGKPRRDEGSRSRNNNNGSVFASPPCRSAPSPTSDQTWPHPIHCESNGDWGSDNNCDHGRGGGRGGYDEVIQKQQEGSANVKLETLSCIAAACDLFNRVGREFCALPSAAPAMNCAISDHFSPSMNAGNTIPPSLSHTGCVPATLPAVAARSVSTRLEGCLNLKAKQFFSGLHAEQLVAMRFIVENDMWHRLAVNPSSRITSQSPVAVSPPSQTALNALCSTTDSLECIERHVNNSASMTFGAEALPSLCPPLFPSLSSLGDSKHDANAKQVSKHAIKNLQWQHPFIFVDRPVGISTVKVLCNERMRSFSLSGSVISSISPSSYERYSTVRELVASTYVFGSSVFTKLHRLYKNTLSSLERGSFD